MARAEVSTPPPPGGEIDLPGPDQATRRERLLLGALILAIGSAWIALPPLSLITGAPPALPGLSVAGTCALVAVGIGHVLWALELLLRRRTLVIGQTSLQLSVRGFLGVRRWDEPLANYRGLRHRPERVRHRYGWRMVHRLELAHPDPARELCLISTRDGRRIEACGRQWAARLGLPMLPAESTATPGWSSIWNRVPPPPEDWPPRCAGSRSADDRAHSAASRARRCSLGNTMNRE